MRKVLRTALIAVLAIPWPAFAEEESLPGLKFTFGDGHEITLPIESIEYDPRVPKYTVIDLYGNPIAVTSPEILKLLEKHPIRPPDFPELRRMPQVFPQFRSNHEE